MGSWDPDSRFILSGWFLHPVSNMQALAGQDRHCIQADIATRHTARWLYSTWASRISKCLPGSQGRKRTEKSQEGEPTPGQETTHVIAQPDKTKRKGRMNNKKAMEGQDSWRWILMPCGGRPRIVGWTAVAKQQEGGRKREEPRERAHQPSQIITAQYQAKEDESW